MSDDMEIRINNLQNMINNKQTTPPGRIVMQIGDPLKNLSQPVPPADHTVTSHVPQTSSGCMSAWLSKKCLIRYALIVVAIGMLLFVLYRRMRRRTQACKEKVKPNTESIASHQVPRMSESKHESHANRASDLRSVKKTYVHPQLNPSSVSMQYPKAHMSFPSDDIAPTHVPVMLNLYRPRLDPSPERVEVDERGPTRGEDIEDMDEEEDRPGHLRTDPYLLRI